MRVWLRVGGIRPAWNVKCSGRRQMCSHYWGRSSLEERAEMPDLENEGDSAAHKVEVFKGRAESPRHIKPNMGNRNVLNITAQSQARRQGVPLWQPALEDSFPPQSGGEGLPFRNVQKIAVRRSFTAPLFVFLQRQVSSPLVARARGRHRM